MKKLAAFLAMPRVTGATRFQLKLGSVFLFVLTSSDHIFIICAISKMILSCVNNYFLHLLFTELSHSKIIKYKYLLFDMIYFSWSTVAKQLLYFSFMICKTINMAHVENKVLKKRVLTNFILNIYNVISCINAKP